MRDNFGHALIATTSASLHSEEDVRHEATQERHRIGWTSKAKGPSARQANGNSAPVEDRIRA